MFGSFPPGPLVGCASKVYSGLGADIVYGIITLTLVNPGEIALIELSPPQAAVCILALHRFQPVRFFRKAGSNARASHRKPSEYRG